MHCRLPPQQRRLSVSLDGSPATSSLGDVSTDASSTAVSAILWGLRLNHYRQESSDDATSPSSVTAGGSFGSVADCGLEQAERLKIRILKHTILRSFRVMLPMTFQVGLGKLTH